MTKILHTCSRITILLFLPIAFATPAFSAGIKLKTDKGAPVLVNADNYAGDSESHVMELTGHVHVIYSEQAISCDHAVIHDLSNEIEADGHLIIDSSTVHVEGERANLNYKTNLGVIENGFVVSGQIMLEGDRITKIGPDEYIAEKGNYTACTTCPPAWGFRAREIDAQLGGYARLRSVLFEVLNFPVLWLPYLIVPLKSDRQSGFLIPRISITPSAAGAKGFQVGFSESYFWAIDRSQDATISIKSTPANGVKGSVDYRYLLSETSRGELSMGAIQDKFFDGYITSLDPADSPLSANFTRWYFHYEHHYDLPDGFTQNTKINMLSDFNYPTSFPEDYMSIAGERALESRFTLSKNTEITHSSLDASYYLNLLKADPLNGGNGTLMAGNTDAVHRAPELRFSTVNTKIGNTHFLFHSDFNYVHFARQDMAYDDLSTCTNSLGQVIECYDPSRGLVPGTTALIKGTGQFDPEIDAMRTGDRFDMHPEIAYPFQIGRFLDVVPSMAFRYTQYNFDVSPDNPTQSPSPAQDPNVIPYSTFPSRSYFTEAISARSRMSTVWGTDPGNPREIKYKHEFEPEIRVTHLSGMNETQSPFLNSNDHTPEFLEDQPITDNDLFNTANPLGLQFDYNDRVISKNIITGLITNKIIKKTWTKPPVVPTNPDLKPVSLDANIDEANYLQIIEVKLWQSFDLDAATRSPRYPWSDIDALIDFRFQNLESNLLLRYYPYQNVTNTSLRSRMFDKYGNFLQVTYDQDFKITENLADSNYGNPSNHAESIGLGAGFIRKYVKLLGNINLHPVNFKNSYYINSFDVLLNLTPPGNCWGVGIHVLHGLGQVGASTTINFDYQFGGSKTAGTTEQPVSTSPPGSSGPPPPTNNI